MPEKSHKHRSRYDVSGNPEAQYMDEEKEVMMNVLGITDATALEHLEEEGLAHAYERLLGEVTTDTPMTAELLRYIHRCIFADLYAWAGRWRTVQISKPGTQWPPPQYLDTGMQTFEREVLQRYPASALGTDEEFCRAAAHIQGEFLAIHPFREGNARTIKLLTDLLASQTGRPLLRYDMSKKGADGYIDAAKAAFHDQDYTFLEGIIRQALHTGLRPS